MTAIIDIPKSEAPPARRYMRMREVRERIGISRSAIYQAMHEGRFPRPIRVYGKSVAWLESDIEAWMNQRETISRRRVRD